MNIWRRAGFFLLRKKSKTLILLLLLTVIATLVLTCISIGNATDLAKKDLRESMGGYFKIKTNYEQGYNEPVNDSLVREVTKSHGIKSYNGMDIIYMLTDSLELKPGRFTSEGDVKAKLARFLGNTDSSLHEYFVLRTFALKEGRHIAPDDSGKAVISETLAQRNHLTIGDSFKPVLDGGELSKEQKDKIHPYPMEIVGIYQINTAQNTHSANTAECDIAENFIFTDTASVRNINETILDREIHEYSNEAAFFVSDPKDLDEIVSSLAAIPGYNWDGYTVVKNNKTYDNSAAPLERMTGLIAMIVFVIAIISLVMLSLVLVMWIRDRMHEIGVFLSIGIKKTGIIGQHLLENLLVASVALLIAWGITSLVANKIGNIFFNTVTENTEIAPKEAKEQMLHDGDPVEVQKNISETLIDVRVGGIEFLEIMGIGFLIVIASTGISSIIVIKMNPKDILSKMS